MFNLRRPIFLFLFFVFLHKSEILDAQTANVCSTPQCKYAALTISKYMDPSVAPCDDFNKFVCGTFLKNTTISKGKRWVDEYDIIDDQIQEQLKKSLEEKTQPNEPKWTTLAKNYYTSCTNTAAIEKNGLRGVSDDLKQIGGWPVLEKSWNETNYEWKKSTYTLHKLGYGPHYFFSLQVRTDPSNSKKRVLNIDQPPFTVGREFLVKGLKDPKVTAYLDYMVDIAVIFGANKDAAKKELQDSLNFEIALATISKSDADKKNTRMMVKDLQKNYASIPWKEYVNSLYSAIKSNIVIGDDEIIIVGVPTFFGDFEKLIKRTPKRVQANYQSWRAVQDDIDYLTAAAWQRQLKFTNMLNSENKIQDRRQFCLDMTLLTYLKLSVGALYVRKHFSPAFKKSAVELTLDIEKQFKKVIDKADWLDAKSKQNALNRLATIKNYIGYPDEFFNDKILNEFFKNVEVNPNDYFQASAAIAVFSYNYDFNQLRQPVDGSHWTRHGETYVVGPVFSLEGNGPEIPAGILQDLFFNKDALKYMNYAGIGSFNIAQLINNLFFDVDAYMTKETKITYLAKSDCIKKQYSSYTVEEVGLKLNGALTLTYNINDNAGLNVAYLAYQDWAKANPVEPKLPGLTKYSISQLFWILAAIQKCEKYTPEFLKEIVKTSKLSPSGLRIIGAFANRPQFSVDFNCPAGSKMNPATKCSVW